MKEQTVDEQQFKEILAMWHRIGRGIITLPRLTHTSKGIQISVVSIDNTAEYIYEQSFHCYRDVLGWLGKQSDETIQITL